MFGKLFESLIPSRGCLHSSNPDTIQGQIRHERHLFVVYLRTENIQPTKADTILEDCDIISQKEVGHYTRYVISVLRNRFTSEHPSSSLTDFNVRMNVIALADFILIKSPGDLGYRFTKNRRFFEVGMVTHNLTDFEELMGIR